MKTNHKTAWGRALLTALLVLALCAGMSFAAGAAEGDVAINAANFPDAVFRTYIKENFDTNGDNTLSAEERAAVTEINVSSRGIESLCGIEHFTQLVNLNCDYNNLTSLDVSANTNLSHIMCINNRLTHLDLSANTALFFFVGTQEFEITAEGRTHTMPEGFDADKVTYIYGGTFSGRVLTVDEGWEQVEYEYSVNDSGRTLFVTLSFPALHTHAESGVCKCGKLLLNEKNFPDAVFRAYIQETFDIDDDNTLSAEERAAVTQITVPLMQIADLTGVNYFTNLIGLHCYDNLLTSLDVSGCASLAALYCYNNSLTELILPQGTALTSINCSGNNLTHLDVSGVKELRELNCSYNRLTHLDLSQNTGLSLFTGAQSFKITVNSLDGAAWTYEAPEGFDANKVSGLAGGTFSGRVLTLSTNAPIENVTEVTYTYDTGREGKTMSVILFVEKAHLHADTGMCSCGAGVRINEQNFPDAIFRGYVAGFDSVADGFLTAEELAAVTKINVNDMGISDLTGVEYFTELTVLECSDNNLTSLDVSALTKLIKFTCMNNKLTALDLSNNTALRELRIGKNCLAMLDLSKNTELDVCSLDLQTIHVTVDEAARFDMRTINPLFDVSKVTGIAPKDDKIPKIMLDGDKFIMLTSNSAPHVSYGYLTGFVGEENDYISVQVAVEEHHTHSFTNNTCACGAVKIDVFSDSAFNKYIRDTYFNGSLEYCLTPMELATVTSIDLTSVEGVAEFTGIEYFTSLVTLIAPNQSITSLDLSGLAKLQTVNLSGSAGLTSLNLAGCTALTTLNVSNCASLGTLDVSSLAALTTLDVSSTQISSLNLSANTALTSLDISSTPISSLNLSANTALTTLDVFNSKLVNLDLSGVSGEVTLTGQTAVTIIACGTGYVDMAQFGDVAKITYVANGVLGADGWLKLNEGATEFQYTYATGNGETELVVNVVVLVGGSHTYTAQIMPKDEAQHYTEACSVCRAGNENAVENHTYADGVCQNCAYACEHVYSDYSTGICENCGKQFAMCLIYGMSPYYFDSFADALAKAEELYAAYEETWGEPTDELTIKLYTTAYADQAVTLTGATVTLDLNGNRLLFNYMTVEGTRWTLDGATLTIKDTSEAGTGNITNVSGYGSRGIELTNGSSLTLESGTIALYNTYAIALLDGSVATQTGGTVTTHIYISGGTYNLTGGTIAVDSAAAFEVNPAESNIINISGGTVSVNDTSYENGLLDSGLNRVNELTITGGTFINTSGEMFGVNAPSDATVEISGGTFENGVYSATGLGNMLPTGYAFINEGGNAVSLATNNSFILEKVTVGLCINHTGGTAYCERGAICDCCGSEYGEYAPGVHHDGNSDGMCDICSIITLEGAGTESDPYIVTNSNELLTAANATVNEKNYVKLGADINEVFYTNIDFNTTPFELDLNGHRLYLGGAVQIKDDVIGTIKNGTLDANVSVLSENAHLYIDGVTGMGNIISCSGGRFTITASSFKAIYISGDNGMVTATNVTITPTSGGIFNLYSGQYNSNSTLVLEGETYTESLADTHWPHMGSVKRVSNGDGTHNECLDCCDKVITANIACSYYGYDCTTERTCEHCGYVKPAQTAHTLVIKWYKDGTHHTLKCTNDYCNHEEDAEHVYEDITKPGDNNLMEGLVNTPTCTEYAVFHQFCQCGAMGTETFTSNLLDPSKHSGNKGKLVSNGDGTHKVLWDCCDATYIPSIRCSAINDYDCTTPDLCQGCGYEMVPAQAAHDFSWYSVDAKQHFLNCQNVRNGTCAATSGDWEEHTDATGDFKCDACDQDITMFIEVNISLGQDIKVNYYIYAVSFTTLEMRFSVNGYTKTVQGVPDGDQYKFTFDGVAPHWIGDTITAEILIDGKVAKTQDYSVKEYLNELKNKTASELGMSDEKYNAMITLINDLLVYGGAAQEYTGHKTDSLASSGITGTQFADVTTTDTTVQNGTVTFTSATVFFDSVNRLKFKFTASDLGGVTFKVRVNGGEESTIGYVSNGDGTYTITTGAIFAYCFDDVYTVTAYKNGVADAVLTYSVKSYVFAKQGEADNIAALVKATYNYGLSAKAYKEFN